MTMHAVLLKCRVLSASSQDAIYSPIGVAEIIDILTRGIELLELGAEPNRDELRRLVHCRKLRWTMVDKATLFL